MLRRHSLGIHIGHDRGAALVSHGELVAQTAEERLDRKKHSNSPELPLKSIEAVLRLGNVSAGNLGVVGISYTNVVVERILPLLAEEIRDTLGVPSLEVIGVGHHDCHAWSSYFTSDCSRALILVADGSGDIIGSRLEAESLYSAAGDSISLLDRRLQDPGSSRMTRRNSYLLPYMNDTDRHKDISLGNKYEQYTYLAGFEQREGGKTMGLAAYAKPLVEPEVPTICDLQFPLEFETGIKEIDQTWRRSGQPWHRFSKLYAAEIAATGQQFIEKYMIALLNAINPHGTHETLCGAGGVFLNCQMNSRILNDTKFGKLHVVPAAGDDGQSIGAAYFAYASRFHAPSRSSNCLPYLGPSYCSSDVREQLTRFGLRDEGLETQNLLERMAKALAEGKTLGLLRGRSEVGPRALCHRSILADPRRPDMKDRLNQLKGREMFRPFAPVVTVEDQKKFFELEAPSPYMLIATQLQTQFREFLPAIMHIDGSSRVQSISHQKEPFVHSLLRSFEALTGYPILINTSFNVSGDPIVETPGDAIATYLKSGIDCLVIENFWLSKSTGQCA